MQQSHGVGYAEYSHRLAKRMQVEKEREMDYRQGKEAIRDVGHQVHR